MRLIVNIDDRALSVTSVNKKKALNGLYGCARSSRVPSCAITSWKKSNIKKLQFSTVINFEVIMEERQKMVQKCKKITIFVFRS